MTGCQKKITRPSTLEEDRVVACGAPPDAIEIGHAITILVCREHHVEIAEAIRDKTRMLRRRQTNVMALVSRRTTST
ncbi:MAG: hypothetical protein ACRD1X_22095 [Vicinamibacteria bacterium]